MSLKRNKRRQGRRLVSIDLEIYTITGPWWDANDDGDGAERLQSSQTLQ
jgi:hypothetical protein